MDHHNQAFQFNSIIYRPTRLCSENIQAYRPGGLHPIMIGDTLKDDRYQIWHKLGSGAFSTVWLAWDNLDKKYIAVKIHSIEGSKRTQEPAIHSHLAKAQIEYWRSPVGKLRDRFNVKGPNGQHTCFVFDLHGPSLQGLRENDVKLRPDIVRILAGDMADGISFLHQNHVAFGDLNTANVLLKMIDLSELSIEGLYQKLGRPVQEEIRPLKETGMMGGHAPRMLYGCIDFHRVDIDLFIPHIVLTDLNEAALTNDPEGNYNCRIHFYYAAPEFMFGIDKKHSKASDIWALACCFFELRMGQMLLHGDNLTTYTSSIQQLLGPVPQILLENKDCRQALNEIALAAPEALSNGTNALRRRLEALGNRATSREGPHELGQPAHEYLHGTNRAPEICISGEVDSPSTSTPGYARLSVEELADLSDLLSRMLRYLPQDRITVEEVLAHPWLNRQYHDIEGLSEKWIERIETHPTNSNTFEVDVALSKKQLVHGNQHLDSLFPSYDHDDSDSDIEAGNLEKNSRVYWDAREMIEDGYGESDSDMED